MCTCVDEIDNSNNNGGVDLMEKRVAVQVDSADVVAVLLERMPATIYSSLNSTFKEKMIRYKIEIDLNMFSKYSEAEARTTL